MPNEYYNASGYPATLAPGSSTRLREQLANIALGFDKLPVLAGNAGRLVRVNAAGTALETTTVASPTQTMGDLIVRSATTDARLPVGVNGDVLTADSAEPLGVKWAPGSSFVYAANAPPGPRAGDRWLDSDSGILYTFVDDGTSAQWVEL